MHRCLAFVWTDDRQKFPCDRKAKWQVTGTVEGKPVYYCGIHVRRFKHKSTYHITPISETQSQEKKENEPD